MSPANLVQLPRIGSNIGNCLLGNNLVENQIRPIAIGRLNWLFAGSLGARQRAAAVMGLVFNWSHAVNTRKLVLMGKAG